MACGPDQHQTPHLISTLFNAMLYKLDIFTILTMTKISAHKVPVCNIILSTNHLKKTTRQMQFTWDRK
jgi:hypothetical protein